MNTHNHPFAAHAPAALAHYQHVGTWDIHDGRIDYALRITPKDRAYRVQLTLTPIAYRRGGDAAGPPPAADGVGRLITRTQYALRVAARACHYRDAPAWSTPARVGYQRTITRQHRLPAEPLDARIMQFLEILERRLPLLDTAATYLVATAEPPTQGATATPTGFPKYVSDEHELRHDRDN